MQWFELCPSKFLGSRLMPTTRNLEPKNFDVLTAEYPPFVRASVQQEKAELYYGNIAKLYKAYIYSLTVIEL